MVQMSPQPNKSLSMQCMQHLRGFSQSTVRPPHRSRLLLPWCPILTVCTAADTALTALNTSSFTTSSAIRGSSSSVLHSSAPVEVEGDHAHAGNSHRAHHDDSSREVQGALHLNTSSSGSSTSLPKHVLPTRASPRPIIPPRRLRQNLAGAASQAYPAAQADAVWAAAPSSYPATNAAKSSTTSQLSDAESADAAGGKVLSPLTAAILPAEAGAGAGVPRRRLHRRAIGFSNVLPDAPVEAKGYGNTSSSSSSFGAHNGVHDNTHHGGSNSVSSNSTMANDGHSAAASVAVQRAPPSSVRRGIGIPLSQPWRSVSLETSDARQNPDRALWHPAGMSTTDTRAASHMPHPPAVDTPEMAAQNLQGFKSPACAEPNSADIPHWLSQSIVELQSPISSTYTATALQLEPSAGIGRRPKHKSSDGASDIKLRRAQRAPSATRSAPSTAPPVPSASSVTSPPQANSLVNPVASGASATMAGEPAGSTAVAETQIAETEAGAAADVVTAVPPAAPVRKRLEKVSAQGTTSTPSASVLPADTSPASPTTTRKKSRKAAVQAAAPLPPQEAPLSFRMKLESTGVDTERLTAVLAARDAASATLSSTPLLADAPGMGISDPRVASAVELLGFSWALDRFTCWRLVRELLPRLHHVTSFGPRRAFAFDLETSGTYAAFDRICDMSFVDFETGDEFNSLQDPEMKMSSSVVAVHGISNEMVADVQPKAEHTSLAFLLWVYQHCRAAGGAQPVFVAHNARFDVTFITRQLMYMGCIPPPNWSFLDTLVVARQQANAAAIGEKLGREGHQQKLSRATGKLMAFGHNLLDMCRFYDLPPPVNAHRARDDVIATAALLQCMLQHSRFSNPNVNAVLNSTKATAGAASLSSGAAVPDLALKPFDSCVKQAQKYMEVFESTAWQAQRALANQRQALLEAATLQTFHHGPAFGMHPLPYSTPIAEEAAVILSSGEAAKKAKPASPLGFTSSYELDDPLQNAPLLLRPLQQQDPAQLSADAPASTTAFEPVGAPRAAVAGERPASAGTRSTALTAGALRKLATTNGWAAANADFETLAGPVRFTMQQLKLLQACVAKGTLSNLMSLVMHYPRDYTAYANKVDPSLPEQHIAVVCTVSGWRRFTAGARLFLNGTFEVPAASVVPRAEQQGSSWQASTGPLTFTATWVWCGPPAMWAAGQMQSKHPKSTQWAVKAKLKCTLKGLECTSPELLPADGFNYAEYSLMPKYASIKPLEGDFAFWGKDRVLTKALDFIRSSSMTTDPLPATAWGQAAARMATFLPADPASGADFDESIVPKPEPLFSPVTPISEPPISWWEALWTVHRPNPTHLEVPILPHDVPASAAGSSMSGGGGGGATAAAAVTQTRTLTAGQMRKQSVAKAAALLSRISGLDLGSEADPMLDQLRAAASAEPALQLYKSKLDLARWYLAFVEMYLVQLHLLLQRRAFLSQGGSNALPADIFDTTLVDAALAPGVLPFNLTDAQERALSQILNDMRSSESVMYRLLQGDVGSGKTVIAFLAMLAAAGSGYQAIMLAPTEILAQQHYVKLQRLVDDLQPEEQQQIRGVALLTSSTTAKDKRQIVANIKDGSCGLVVGTHSLLFLEEWHKLGLIVIDEQHKFGVKQKEALSRCAAATTQPHVLSMSATPIPRTLALVQHGRMVVSTLDECPPNRLAVKTCVVKDEENTRQELWAKVKEELDAGGRAFIVYPLKQEKETSEEKDEAKEDLRNATNEYEQLQSSGVFGKHKCELLHGGMKATAKTAAMDGFRTGETKVLVCTVVVEVGVDVPEASIMVVEHADRFGLAQLHQLRGRVGRGSRASCCYLLAPVGDGSDESTIATQRLKVMERSNNGFELAEFDLQFRGAGDVMGGAKGKQHGALGCTDLCQQEIAKDGSIVEIARRAAALTLSEGELPLATQQAYAAMRFDTEGDLGLEV